MVPQGYESMVDWGQKAPGSGAAAGSSLLEQQPGNRAVTGMAGACDLEVHSQ